MSTVEKHTMSDVINAFQLYVEHLDITILNEEELYSLNALDDFWDKQNVTEYEKSLDIDKFYDIKVHHTILNGKHRPESKIDIDLKWWDYIGKAMHHRLDLTAKLHIPMLKLLNNANLN